MDMHNKPKVTIIIKNIGNLIANANVSLETVNYGYVTIKGFQIWKSGVFNERFNEKINITPPSRPIRGHFAKQVFFEDKNKWRNLEQTIYDVFNSKRNNGVNEDLTDEDLEKISEDIDKQNNKETSY